MLEFHDLSFEFYQAHMLHIILTFRMGIHGKNTWGSTICDLSRQSNGKLASFDSSSCTVIGFSVQI